MDYQFSRVPQDDLVGIKYVKNDYDTGPAKGLIHGLQKDAIQNSVGAAKHQKTLNGWRVEFELISVKGKDSLVFTDFGTVGLSGQILEPHEILAKAATNQLGANENLSRFLCVFVSGGNVGPGSYGRGKLVFQACSATYTIVCDSLREDGVYLAFKRTIDNNNTLVQTQIFQGSAAVEFMAGEVKTLKPLAVPGTRVTILDLDPTPQLHDVSIKQAFLNSFEQDFADEECMRSFSGMIQETWWEILLKHNAQIVLKHGRKEVQVGLSNTMRDILTKTDGQDNWVIYEKERVPVTIGDVQYKVKRIRFAVVPQGQRLPDFLQEIFAQRKRMKIGKLNKNIEPDNKIKKRLCGIIEMEPELESLMLAPENLTHSGYKNFRGSVIQQVRQVIKTHLESLHERLGLVKRTDDTSVEREIRDALKDLNEAASEFGLMSSFGIGKESRLLAIRFKEFILPNAGSLRVEYSDSVGPVTCEVRNRSKDQYSGEFVATLSQVGNDHIQRLLVQPIVASGGTSLSVEVPAFTVDQNFRYGEGVLLKVELSNQRVRNSRMLWLGIEEPKKPKDRHFTLDFDSPKFPRPQNKRVEIGEQITDIGFTIGNDTGAVIRANVTLSVRRDSMSNKDDLIQIVREQGFEFQPLSEEHFESLTAPITAEIFSIFADKPLTHDARCCALFLKVTSSEHYPDLGIAKGDVLCPRKKVHFWIGIDDPGMSIFSEIRTEDNSADPRRSWATGNAGSGFIFHLNQGHRAFARLAEAEDLLDLRLDYYKEEMLKQAFIISMRSENFKGLFKETSTGGETYANTLLDGPSVDEGISTFEEIMGLALHRLFA